MNLFSGPKPKAMSIGRRSSLTFNIFDFFFERYSTKLDIKQDLNVLCSVCYSFFFFFFGPIGNPISPSWPLICWYIFDFFFLKPLNGIQRNWAGRNISTSSTKFVFFKPIGNQIWPSWSLIGWDIFDFFSVSKTAERNTNETWQEARPQRCLSSLRFSGWSEIQDSRPGL